MFQAPLVRPDYHIDDWIAYGLGAFLTLFYKWGKYVRLRKKAGVEMKDATIEWFFEPSAHNVTSWTTTIGIVWVCGSVYISKFDIGSDYVKNLAVSVPFSFTLGAVVELFAPRVIRWLVTKLPISIDLSDPLLNTSGPITPPAPTTTSGPNQPL